jgi:hypothetical protein
MLVTLVAFLTALSKPRAAQAASPSTPEERARVVQLAHKLESNPTDESLTSEREWAIKWLIQAPDITVEMCPAVIGDFHKYKYSSEITTQLLLSSAAYVIEHPESAKDRNARFLGGTEGALKAYRVLQQAHPKDKSKTLDEMVQRQEEGKLADTVRENAAKGCKPPSN